MSERGFTLVEALVSLGVMALVLTPAMGVVIALPRQAARWEDAADSRQRVRVIDARGARLAAGAGPITVRVGAADIRVPSIWPRRLGLSAAGAPGDVRADALTFLSRTDGHRLLFLDEPLGTSGAAVAFRPGAGCGAAPACRVSAGDILMAVSAAGDLGLFRVTAVTARLTLDALMPGASFAAGSALVPVTLSTLSLAESEIRLYDGYRTEGVLVDGLVAFTLACEPGGLRFDDGPWIGAGPLAFDADQLLVRGVRADIALVAREGVPAARAVLFWGIR